MSFIDEIRNTRQEQRNDEAIKNDIARGWEARINGVAKRLADSETAAGNKISVEDAKSLISNYVKASGVRDGKWTQKQADSDDFDNYDFQEYGSDLLDDTFSNVGSRDSAAKEYIKESITSPSFQKGLRGIYGSNILNLLAPTPLGKAINNGFLFGATEGLIKDVKSFNKNINEYYEKKNKDAFDDGFDLIKNYSKYYNKDGSSNGVDGLAMQSTSTGGKWYENGANGGSSAKSTADDETTDETVTFTLTANDPNYRGFGQKLVDLGLATDNGLWGENGDVKFYEKQLADQGAIDIVGDRYGNLKTGVPIKLRKRKNRKS